MPIDLPSDGDLNWGGVLRTAFTELETVALSAETNAAQASSDAGEVLALGVFDDADMAGVVLAPASATGVAVRTVVDQRVGQASLSGLYAARPSAASVPAGSMYFPTDVPEMYRSTGTAWAVVGSGGNELGYAQSITASPAVTGATVTDVPGLTCTFIPGDRPVEVSVSLDVSHSAVGGVVVVYIIVDGVTIARPNVPTGPIGTWHTVERAVRRSGLAPGVPHTAKIAIATPAGTTVVQGDASNPMSVTVSTR